MNMKQTTSPNEKRNTPEVSCCGGPAPVGVGACCADDAAIRSTGGTGCGCSGDNARDNPGDSRGPAT
jgi:hypothetical protein